MRFWIRLAKLLSLLLVSVIATMPMSHAEKPSITERWEARYDGHAYDDAAAMAVSPDGTRVFVTGKSEGGSGIDVATVAFDALTGATLWSNRYDGPAHDLDVAVGIVASPDGSKVFVAGSTGGPSNFLVLAMDAATGNGLWTRRYGAIFGGSDDISAITMSPDGSTVFVTGTSYIGFAQPTWTTIAFNANTGKRQWVKRLGDANHTGLPAALAVSPDGTTLFVTGESVPPGYSDQRFVTVAYDSATGTRVWSNSYQGGAGAGATDIAVRPDGSQVFVTGSIDTAPYDYDYQTIAYDAATGTELWAERYVGPSYADTASAIAVSADGGRVFVTGTSQTSPGDEDFATVAYDAATGNQAWVKRFGDPYEEDETANSIEVTPDGSTVFVGGTGPASSPFWHDFITVAYAAGDGALIGATSYDGRLHQEDRESDMVLSPDGLRLFVTGDSDELRGHNYDYATVAYDV
jgi:WD40 repeat protein